jgi:NitT/TauT family transport system permease protein
MNGAQDTVATSADSEQVAQEPATTPAPAASGVTGSRARKIVYDWGPVVAVGVVLLIVWQLLAISNVFGANTISEPTRVAVRLVQAVEGRPMFGFSMWTTAWHTMLAVLIGYLIGAGGGMIIGYILARNAFVAEVIDPYLRAIAAVPKITLVPLLVLILGIGVKAEAANVILMTFVIVVYSTFSAISGVNEEYVNIARVMGAKGSTVTFSIVLKGALPAIMGGLRAGVPAAFVGAITSEFIASSQGLGWYLQQATSKFDPTGLFTGLVFVLAFVILFVGAIDLLQWKLIKWRRQ